MKLLLMQNNPEAWLQTLFSFWEEGEVFGVGRSFCFPFGHTLQHAGSHFSDWGSDPLSPAVESAVLTGERRGSPSVRRPRLDFNLVRTPSFKMVLLPSRQALETWAQDVGPRGRRF